MYRAIKLAIIIELLHAKLEIDSLAPAMVLRNAEKILGPGS
jgi:hypothetical protein